MDKSIVSPFLTHGVHWEFPIVHKAQHNAIQGGPKKLSHILLSISSPNIHRFSKYFHLHILWKIC